MKRPIRAVALDLEGTIVDVESAHHQGHLTAAREVGLELTLDSAYRVLPHFIGGPDAKVAEDIYEAAGCPAQSSVEAILASTLKHYEENLKTINIALRPGVEEALFALETIHVPVAIGSLTPVNQAMVLLERSGLLRKLGRERIVLAEDVKNPKPAPDVFLETVRRLGVDPVHQLVFEDSPRGVQAAIAAGSRAIGMPVVLEPFESTVLPLIKAGAYWIFRDWRDLDIGSLIFHISNQQFI